MGFNQRAAVDVVGAHPAVIRTLRAGVAVLIGKAERAAAFEEGVLLLYTEQGLLIGELLGDIDQAGPAIGGMRTEVGEEHFTKHEQVGAATDRVGAGENRLQNTVGRLAGSLICAGPVESPDRKI